jgi:hypothetical protein
VYNTQFYYERDICVLRAGDAEGVLYGAIELEDGLDVKVQVEGHGVGSLRSVSMRSKLEYQLVFNVVPRILRSVDDTGVYFLECR